MSNWYVADFETTDYITYEKEGNTRVWLYSICDSNENIVENGTSIEQFMKTISKMKKPLIYFHNLKFDGSFILNWLLENGFEWKEKLILRDNRGFSTLIGEEGQYYQIKINFAHDKQVIIQDSLKIIPLKVKEIAKAFNMEIEKEVINYNEYVVNEKTLHYVNNDTKIVCRALRFFKDNGYDKMTIGSNSYNLFKNENPLFNELFPNLDREWLIEWREAYRGGRSQVNPLYQNKIVSNVKRYDINSMYPYVMATAPIPYGKPIRLKERGRFKFELYKIDVCFKLKKGHLPTLLKKGCMYGMGNDTYYINSDCIERIYISNIDLELLYRHYNIEYIEFLEIWGFKTSTYIFRDFVNKMYALKSSSEGGMKMLYKLLINNLYGKFGSKCKSRNKIPILNDNDSLSYTMSEEQDLKIYYLPVAIQVCSYAHKLIDDAIMKTGYNNFVYCDTDSVHTLGDLPSEWVDNKILGKFKLEAIEDKAKYIRQKCYVHREEEKGQTKYTITCAGMTEGLKEYMIRVHKDNVFEEFKIGLTINKDSKDIRYEELKLRPMQVKGGVVLKPCPFTLQ